MIDDIRSFYRDETFGLVRDWATLLELYIYLASYSFAFFAARIMAEAEAVEPAAGTDAPSTCSATMGLAIVLHVLDCEYS